MSFNQMSDFTFKHSDQVDDLYKVFNSAQIKEKFDSQSKEIRDYILTEVVAKLNSVTDGSSGADNISATPISDLGMGLTTLQAMLEKLVSNLRGVVDGSSGADFIKSTAITGVTGDSVQTQLESIKTLIDDIQNQVNNLDSIFATDSDLLNRINEINTAWDSADDTLQALIDGKSPVGHTHTKTDITDLVLTDYYTKAELDALILNNAGFHEEVFIATPGQTDFILTESSYETGKNRIRVFVQGVRLSESEIVEVDEHTVRLSALAGGEEVIVEYVTDMGVSSGNVTVSSTQPLNPRMNDLWVEV